MTSHTSDPVPRRQGRPPKSNVGPLDRAKIISAALDMTHSAEGKPLTFRALGSRLGVDPAALYRYISSKDGLLLAVADGIFDEALAGFTETGVWREDLTDLLWRVHTAYLEHPEVAVSAVTRVTRLDAEMTFTETMLRILATAGLDDAQAVLTYRSLEDTMLAWTGFKANVERMENPEAERRDWGQVYRQADPQIYPRVSAQATPMTAASLHQVFETSLALLLDGIELRISRSAGATA